MEAQSLAESAFLQAAVAHPIERMIMESAARHPVERSLLTPGTTRAEANFHIQNRIIQAL